MAKFTDNQNREWTIELDGPLLEAVEDHSGVDLTDLRSDPLGDLAFKPRLLVDVIYILCEEQAKAASVNSREFGRHLRGCLDPAVEALQKAIIDFFPAGKRSLMQSLLEQNQIVTEKMTALAKTKIENPTIHTRLMDSISRNMDQTLDRHLKTPSNSPSASTTATGCATSSKEPGAAKPAGDSPAK